MRVTFAPLQLLYARQDHPRLVDEDVYSADVEVDGDRRQLLVTVSGHSEYSVAKMPDEDRQRCVTNIAAVLLSGFLPHVPEKLDISASENDVFVPPAVMEEERYVVSRF